MDVGVAHGAAILGRTVGGDLAVRTACTGGAACAIRIDAVGAIADGAATIASGAAPIAAIVRTIGAAASTNRHAGRTLLRAAGIRAAVARPASIGNGVATATIAVSSRATCLTTLSRDSTDTDFS